MLARHVPSYAIAFFFLVFGAEKLAGTGGWIEVFDRIGFGQWFRYVTGVMQVGGACLMVFRRTSLLGALLLAATMAGAVAAQLLVLGGAGDAAVPAIMLLAVAGVAILARLGREETSDQVSAGRLGL